MLPSSRHDRLPRTPASSRLDSAHAEEDCNRGPGRLWPGTQAQAPNSMLAPVRPGQSQRARTNLRTEAVYKQVRRTGRWEPQRRLTTGTCRANRHCCQKWGQQGPERIGNSGNFDGGVPRTPAVSESAIGEKNLRCGSCRNLRACDTWAHGWHEATSGYNRQSASYLFLLQF